MIHLQLSITDDPAFADRVTALINGAAVAEGIRSVSVVKIDNWFGRRWLKFSHKIMGVVGCRGYGPNLTLPPFKPSRVVSERCFERRDGSDWYQVADPAPVHLDQPGTKNQWRRVRELFPDTAFFWWSGGSRTNGRGSLMAYLPGACAHSGWYVESCRDHGWRESDRLLITAQELDAMAKGPGAS